METTNHEWAKVMVANGFGFGKYWAGYVFARTAKDPFLLYLTDHKMAVLSQETEEDGERQIIEASDRLPLETLQRYFGIDPGKKSSIDWLGQPVHLLLLCADKEKVRNNTLYFMWPAVQLRFVNEVTTNTIIVYDRQTPQAELDACREKVRRDTLEEGVEFWSMLKLLAVTDRFGELAPKTCMESVLAMTKRL
jgi:hypothetical protein